MPIRVRGVEVSPCTSLTLLSLQYAERTAGGRGNGESATVSHLPVRRGRSCSGWWDEFIIVFSEEIVPSSLRSLRDGC